MWTEKPQLQKSSKVIVKWQSSSILIRTLKKMQNKNSYKSTKPITSFPIQINVLGMTTIEKKFSLIKINSVRKILSSTVLGSTFGHSLQQIALKVILMLLMPFMQSTEMFLKS